MATETGVLLVGAYPPPVHGMAVINQAMADKLVRDGHRVRVIDLAAPSLARGFRYHAVRFRRILRAAAHVLFTRAKWPMYMSVSGGSGQAYEVIFALSARLKGVQLTLHHHSYAYLGRRRLITRLLFAASPVGTRHVALSQGMGRRLQALYGSLNLHILSNAAFLPQAPASALRERSLRNLGFLSNISAEKGIFDFIALLDACSAAGLSVAGFIAGPFEDPRVEADVMALLASRPGIRYVGPKYGDAKRQFLDSIDVLVFPTRYVNEAEPVTIYEALRMSIPVIAYGRGSIPEILDGSHGMSIPPEENFQKLGLSKVCQWMSDGDLYLEARQSARDYYIASRSRAIESLELLVAAVAQTTGAPK